jgi:hypothetical protein
MPLDMVWAGLCGPCPLTGIRVELISVVKILTGHIASHRVIVGVVVARVDLQFNMGSSFLHIYSQRLSFQSINRTIHTVLTRYHSQNLLEKKVQFCSLKLNSSSLMGTNKNIILLDNCS